MIFVPFQSDKEMEPLNFEIMKTGPDKDAFEIEYDPIIAVSETAKTLIIFHPTELGRHIACLDI